MQNDLRPQSKTITTPLFWDFHIHGVAGFDFNQLLTEEECIESCIELGKHGIGYFTPTLISLPPSPMENACAQWGKLLDRIHSNPRFLPTKAALPLGLHLEGPFLNPRKAGAHPPSALKLPSPAQIKRLDLLSQGKIAIVTLAPELDGALATIKELHKRQIRTQLGHSNASIVQASKAAKAGGTGITHLWNAMDFHHRNLSLHHLLLSPEYPDITSEIITDGEHVHPEVILLSLKAFGEKLYGVTDGCCLMGTKKLKGKLGTLNIYKKNLNSKTAFNEKETLAAGTSFLTDHPAFLKPILESQNQELITAFFALFFERQPQLLSKKFQIIAKTQRRKGKNHFDSKTWKFLDRT